MIETRVFFFFRKEYLWKKKKKFKNKTFEINKLLIRLIVGSDYKINFRIRSNLLIRLRKILALNNNLTALITFIAKSGFYPDYLKTKTARLLLIYLFVTMINFQFKFKLI